MTKPLPLEEAFTAMPLTYSTYLALEELLSCQRPRSEGPEHDELLFIIIHQVYELWFKQLLHELDYLCGRLAAGDLAASLHTLKRVLTIWKVQVAQVDILETMTPVSFLSFRSRLEAASGFQSPQFRELEILLGKRDRKLLAHLEGTHYFGKVERRMKEPSLWHRFLEFLAIRGYTLPPEARPVDLEQSNALCPELHPLLIEIYRKGEDLSQLCERLVDLDEGIQEWRYRHVKMVERTIGKKSGTGGSTGADYLKQTLFQPLFPDLWAIRSEL